MLRIKQTISSGRANVKKAGHYFSTDSKNRKRPIGARVQIEGKSKQAFGGREHETRDIGQITKKFDSLRRGRDAYRKEGNRQIRKVSRQPRGKKKVPTPFISFFDELDNAYNAQNSRKYDRRGDKELNSLERKENNNVGDKTIGTCRSTKSIRSLFEENDAVDTSKSIFDAFPIKETKQDFENHFFLQYIEAMEEIISNPKFGKRHTKKAVKDDVLESVSQWLLKDERSLDYEYSALDQSIENGIPESSLLEGNNSKVKDSSEFRSAVSEVGTQSNLFYEELCGQKEKFLTKMEFDETHFDLIQEALNVLASYCARRARTGPLVVGWEKAKEAGFIPTNKTTDTLLYVSGVMSVSRLLTSPSLIGDRGPPRLTSHGASVLDILGDIGSDASYQNDDSEIENQQKKKVDLPTELVIFHDLLFEPTERSISIRVKKLVANGNATGAEQLLDSAGASNEMRLRTYLPVLKLYCEQGDVSSALKLFRRMLDEPNVILEPQNYVLILSTLAERGYFCTQSAILTVNKEQLGFNNSHGPELFDELVSLMADDVLEISSASARRLYNSFAVGYTKHENMPEQLKPIPSLTSIPVSEEMARPNELIVSRVLIDPKSGVCPRSDVKLELIKLDDDQRKQFVDSIFRLSKSRFEEFKERINRNLKHDHGTKALTSFTSWLNSREGKPFTAIIDGANVAYFMQNFEGGSFNFHQIQFMVDALEKMNEHPLVILPHKYMNSSFMVANGSQQRMQKLSKDEKDIVSNLYKRGQLYRVTSGCLDDYFWMVASVSDQIRSRQGRNLDVKTENDKGRWPGTRPMLISNDQMRDHKLELLEPRLFRRWFSCYMVNYNFTAFVGKDSIDREIGFSTADFFSREIQSNESISGKVWHFPVSDWNLNDRLCIRLPR